MSYCNALSIELQTSLWFCCKCMHYDGVVLATSIIMATSIHQRLQYYLDFQTVSQPASLCYETDLRTLLAVGQLLVCLNG